jgi:hypothetical protein
MTPGNSPTGYESGTFLRIATTAAGTGNSYVLMQQRIEDVRVFAGQTITYSFWIRSSTTTSFGGSNMYQNFGSGGSGAVGFTPIGGATISNNWTRVYGTYTIPSISGKTIGTNSYLEIDINLAGGVNTFDIWGVQLEAGSVATPFTTATGTVQGELAACQRYYWRLNVAAGYGNMGMGMASSSTAASIQIPSKVTMRAVPVIDNSATSTMRLTNVSTGSSISAIVMSAYANPDFILTEITSSGLTANTPYFLQSNNSAAYVGFSAEL